MYVTLLWVALLCIRRSACISTPNSLSAIPRDWKTLPANGNGGKNLPPLPVAGCLRRHMQWREVPRGGFSTFRQATFSNKISKGLFLVKSLVRGSYL
jgi:hypothetical protein